MVKRLTYLPPRTATTATVTVVAQLLSHLLRRGVIGPRLIEVISGIIGAHFIGVVFWTSGYSVLQWFFGHWAIRFCSGFRRHKNMSPFMRR